MAEVRAEARRAVKADLALRALAEAQELTVTDDELDAEVAAMAERMEIDAATLRRSLTAPAGRPRYARSSARSRRSRGCSTTWSSSTRKETRCPGTT